MPLPKIIHIDMDCFYAAIEEREAPELRGKPIGVGGSSRRGVLTTANYEARKFGCRSAMPVFKALELCPHIVLVPVRFDLYKSESARIRAIFGRFTEKIEPLSLDEAYLDVSHLQTSPEAVAREIRAQIKEETGLTASAGISHNKLIAKVTSDWNKPDGQHYVPPEEVDDFMRELPVGKLWGIGPKTRAKLATQNIHTCGDLQQFNKIELARRFGKWGLELHDLSRGIDTREVRTHRVRKSISSENTFSENILTLPALTPIMRGMLEGIREDLARKHSDRSIRSLVIKLKFADFTGTTAERASPTVEPAIYEELLTEAWKRGQNKPVRLLGVGVRFRDPEAEDAQLDLL
ncbi:DNA polymerase IV [Haloferula sp.]|uniref:DNA polymerase IV n=1 Tax=Haloferula sp. TaxID=2497595 RepID=UPI00329EDF86